MIFCTKMNWSFLICFQKIFELKICSYLPSLNLEVHAGKTKIQSTFNMNV